MPVPRTSTRWPPPGVQLRRRCQACQLANASTPITSAANAAEQVSNLDRLGDLGFRGARGASVVGEGPDTGRYAANAPTRTSDETRAGSAALRGPQIKLG